LCDAEELAGKVAIRQCVAVSEKVSEVHSGVAGELKRKQRRSSFRILLLMLFPPFQLRRHAVVGYGRALLELKNDIEEYIRRGA
jgi:hypothetical protein